MKRNLKEVQRSACICTRRPVVDWSETKEERTVRELREKMIERDNKINQILEK